MEIPKSHPRYHSLKTRDLIAYGVKKGIASVHGLIAHGRGEAFDYLIGEKTSEAAKKAIIAAAALLLLAKRPVISVNGNAASLVPKGLAKLSLLLHAPLEVNIFHPSRQRELKIKTQLIKNGAKRVLLPDKKHRIKYLESNRKYVNIDGILNADVIFVPLEDGDRTEALVKNGKKVITIDLNPMSRTSTRATVTIADNIIRAIPLLTKKIKHLKKFDRSKLKKVIKKYNNSENLNDALKVINENLNKGGELN
jgi:4-phosphopantoate---beta-alanine ligase